MCCSENHHNQPQTSHDPIDMRFGDGGWCVCPGQEGMGCCGYATADDGLCDRCRGHCKTDHAGAAVAAESVRA